MQLKDKAHRMQHDKIVQEEKLHEALVRAGERQEEVRLKASCIILRPHALVA